MNIKSFFNTPSDHVRITETGRRLLNDKITAGEVIRQVVRHGDKLERGESIIVGDFEISLATRVKATDK